MEPLAIVGHPGEGLLADLARRGHAVVLVGCDPDPPPDARVVLADLDEATEIAWLDRGLTVVPHGSNTRLVAARVAAALRGAGRIVVGPLVIDPVTRTATRAGRPLGLLPREFALLHHLAGHAGCTVSQDALRAAVWGLRFHPGTNLVAVHASRLRARLDHAGEPPMLRTDRGAGYRLVAP